MSKKIDINVEERSHKPYDSNFEVLILEISGSDSNIPLINSFRRACNDNVPKYAFVRELIKINNNKSAYHNDYMTLRLSQLPVFNVKTHDIDPKLDYLHEKYWKNVDYLDKNRNKPDNEKNIEIQINVHNNSDELKAITTSDPGFKVYIDNETNYYTLDIRLFNDMTNLGHVYIIKNKDTEEIINLENQSKKDE
jgi:hypothetical protein